MTGWCPSILTVYDENDLVFEALCAGACGYLVKKTPPARLPDDPGGPGRRLAHELAHREESGEPPASDHGGAEGEPGRAGRNPSHLARARHPENGLAGGNSYRALAKGLNISTDTVRFHIRNIYRKLHVHSQSEAVAKALRKGII